MPISHCLQNLNIYSEEDSQHTVRNKSTNSIKFSRHTKHNQSTGNDITPFHECDSFSIVIKVLGNIDMVHGQLGWKAIFK